MLRRLSETETAILGGISEVQDERREPHRILRPGETCWRLEEADRAAVLVDAEAYFAALDTALRQARRSITILGWDFDGKITLRPEPDAPALGDLLRSLVEDHPELEVRILVWSVAVVHAPGAPLPLLIGAPWQDHPRISVRLDSKHPIYAAHHQKLVAIDDSLAFVGGMDLTVRRWDSCRHEADDPRRVTYEGKAYGPVHDVQAVVDGPAAVALGDLARERWRIATGEVVPAPVRNPGIWPEGVEPEFLREPIGIARTHPAWGPHEPVREAALLTAEAIRAARRSIYIEAQYLTARYIRDILVDHLKREDGPEVVVVLTFCARGFFEKLVMGINGERLIRHLRRHDRHDRLRVFYPSSPGREETECPIHVHAKVVVVDDLLLRIGSSNLNNRSVGLDTECDIAIEGTSPATRRRIAAIRDRLLGEHLDAEPEAVGRTHAEEGSLIRTIDRLNANPRRLKLSPAFDSRGAVRSMPGTFLLDPGKPFEPLWFLKKRT
ncbi:phospholipase D-like domain-containing protein [Prosthecomicrobium sp. N25]|uniref:phospholipase D-like domain-containing protein n=1 Tax=Prosthecomicrobium sp. N25 TaxID=3129254 RepID=UPI0030771A9C